MLRIEVVERVTTPGGEMVLSRRGGDFSIRIRGIELMNSRNHSSEDELGTRTCARIADVRAPRVLVGGLGLGYTLRATLDALPAAARVDVVEIIPAVVRWNREVYGGLAKHPLADPRVTVIEGDVVAVIASAAPASYDAILLDVDNGPDELQEGNDALYTRRGLERAHAALTVGGTLAVWSAFPSDTFTRWLVSVGFEVETVIVKTQRGGPRHVIWFARRRR